MKLKGDEMDAMLYLLNHSNIKKDEEKAEKLKELQSQVEDIQRQIRSLI